MVAHDAAELRHPGKIVLLHVEGTGHPVRIGEARRIEDHQVVLRTLRHGQGEGFGVPTLSGGGGEDKDLLHHALLS